MDGGLLRLGVHGVPAAEAGLVRALVLLIARNTAAFRWTFASEGPYDALIVDSRSPDLADPLLHRSCAALSSLGVPSAAGWRGHVLDRPLQADRLEAWLNAVGAPASTAPAVAAPAAAPRYRLKRWPPAALLHSDVQRVRMATLLSRRPLQIAELARIGALPEDRCRTFVHLLQGFGLLTSEVDPPVPAVRTAPPPPASRGLIHSIRRRLGLVS